MTADDWTWILIGGVVIEVLAFVWLGISLRRSGE